MGRYEVASDEEAVSNMFLPENLRVLASGEDLIDTDASASAQKYTDKELGDRCVRGI